MKERIITILIFFFVASSIFYFGFSRLSYFSGVDEPYWSYGRVPTFWNAVSSMEWKKTNLCDKPGIPLAIVSGAGLPFIGENPKDLKFLRYAPKTIDQLQKIREMYFHLRLPVFLFTIATLPIFYILIKKVLGKNIARFSLIFMGLSPILLGISLIINSDAMLWILSALSTLSLFAYLEKNEKKYLLLSGLFLGLSVIDKYVANILFVYFFAIFFLEYILNKEKDISITRYLKKSFMDYLLLFATALATAFAFFPATWVKFSTLINATIGNDVFTSTWPIFLGTIGLLAIDIFIFRSIVSSKVFGFFRKYWQMITIAVSIIFLFLAAFVFLHVYGGVKIFDLQTIIASPKGIGEGSIWYKFIGALSADLYSLLFSISPIVLIFVLFSVARLMFQKKELDRKMITVFYVILFIFLYYIGSTVNGIITTVRYQIMVYPLIFIIGAIGIDQLMNLRKIKKMISPVAFFVATGILLLASLYFTKPYYLAYASEILPENFIVNFKGMGEGSIEAADYLNRLPNAQNLKIWSDKGAVCEGFLGKCFIDFKESTFRENNIDYFVISTDRRSRSLKRTNLLKNVVDIKKLYGSNDYLLNIIIANNPNDFVRVYESSQFLKNNEISPTN